MIRIGSRRSSLARWQAHYVQQRLDANGIESRIEFIDTTGDRRSEPVGAIGGQGLFTKEIQKALLDKRIDVAVHSLKDLPTKPIPGLRLAAVPPRGPVKDVLVAAAGHSLDQLRSQACIGTGSLRRKAQLLEYRNDLQILPLRGNVDTRLKKVVDGDLDAVVLAEAGLRRLDRAGVITSILPTEILLPAIGQGALGLEARDDDDATCSALQRLNDEVTFQSVTAERSLLSALEGGCLAPIAGWARIEREKLRLEARVMRADGSRRLSVAVEGNTREAERLGQQAAEQLTRWGAAELIAEHRQ